MSSFPTGKNRRDETAASTDSQEINSRIAADTSAATSFAELRRQLDASEGQFYVTVRRDLIYALLDEAEFKREDAEVRALSEEDDHAVD